MDKKDKVWTWSFCTTTRVHETPTIFW